MPIKAVCPETAAFMLEKSKINPKKRRKTGRNGRFFDVVKKRKRK
jgi:hypothetical protein